MKIIAILYVMNINVEFNFLKVFNVYKYPVYKVIKREIIIKMSAIKITSIKSKAKAKR